MNVLSSHCSGKHRRSVHRSDQVCDQRRLLRRAEKRGLILWNQIENCVIHWKIEFRPSIPNIDLWFEAADKPASGCWQHNSPVVHRVRSLWRGYLRHPRLWYDSPVEPCRRRREQCCERQPGSWYSTTSCTNRHRKYWTTHAADTLIINDLTNCHSTTMHFTHPFSCWRVALKTCQT